MALRTNCISCVKVWAAPEQVFPVETLSSPKMSPELICPYRYLYFVESRVQSSKPVHKWALRHQYWGGIHTAG